MTSQDRDNLCLERALVTGGSGMIGSCVGFGIKPTSTELNITCIHSVRRYFEKMSSFSCIIHLAATNLRESEQHPKKAIEVNVDGTIHLVKAAMDLDIPFIYISSGAVFSSLSSSARFDEDVPPCPGSIYGYTKASAERIVMLYDKAVIIRTGWLFGGHQRKHYKFVENVIDRLYSRCNIKGSCDFVGSPTYVNDFIEAMVGIILSKKYGIYHVVNDGHASGYEIALEIAHILGLGTSNIDRVGAADVPDPGPRRSSSEALVTIHTSNPLRSWREALSEYVLAYTSTRFNDVSLTNLVEKEKAGKWKNRDSCRLCGTYGLFTFFNLMPTPCANHFVRSQIQQDLIPLDLAICNHCKHIQLIQIVDPEFQYLDYFYVSSTTKTMTTHLQNSVSSFVTDIRVGKDEAILEIGANDGVCISTLADMGYRRVIGVDPAENIHRRHKLPIICGFFGRAMVETLRAQFTQFRLIYAFHCCAHIEDIGGVFDAVYELLQDDGHFIMEVGYFYELYRQRTFDTIYHEHIDYHTCTAMIGFARRKGLALYKVVENSIQGGVYTIPLL